MSTRKAPFQHLNTAEIGDKLYMSVAAIRSSSGFCDFSHVIMLELAVPGMCYGSPFQTIKTGRRLRSLECALATLKS